MILCASLCALTPIYAFEDGRAYSRPVIDVRCFYRVPTGTDGFIADIKTSFIFVYYDENAKKL